MCTVKTLQCRTMENNALRDSAFGIVCHFCPIYNEIIHSDNIVHWLQNKWRSIKGNQWAGSQSLLSQHGNTDCGIF